MKRKSKVDGRSRRGFLKELAAAGGAVAVAGMAGPALATPAEERPEASDADGRYRETDHVRTYYDKARI